MAEGPRTDVLTAFRACRLWHTASDAAVARLAAAAQVVAYRNGRNGLANNAADRNTYRPDVTFDYNAAWRDDLLRGRRPG